MPEREEGGLGRTVKEKRETQQERRTGWPGRKENQVMKSEVKTEPEKEKE